MRACRDCRFWHKNALGEETGECRRYPKTSYGWPFVMSDDWCGEFREVEYVFDRERSPNQQPSSSDDLP